MATDPDKQPAGALYDFVYLDRKRIGALAAQLFDSGLLTSTKELSSRGDTSSKSGGVDLKVLKAEIGGTTLTREGIERVFDASWSVPLDVIAQLAEQNLVSDNIGGANYGQIVLVEGALRVFDIATLKQLYEPLLDVITTSSKASSDAKFDEQLVAVDFALAQATGQRKHELKQLKTKVATAKRDAAAGMTAAREQVGALFKLIKILPHALQATLANDTVSIWMTLDPAQMITNADDFALKHGSDVPGTWTIVGSLDGRPRVDSSHDEKPVTPIAVDDLLASSRSNASDADAAAPQAPPPDAGDSTTTLNDDAERDAGDVAGDPAVPAPAYSSGAIANMMLEMQNMIRSQFGAPDTAYTITPLAIYRRIEPVTDSDQT